MIWLYRILFIPALIVSSPFYLWRMRKRGGYAENFRQRFGGLDQLPDKTPEKKRIWLQAVSVGEMLAIEPILVAWEKDEEIEVYLTTTTSTGYRLACERYHGLTIGIGYFPIDWVCFSRRAWKKIRPDLVILTEGERWPEHIRQAQSRGVPVVAVNARLSDRSFRRMQWGRPALRSLFGGITHVLACSEEDAKRFHELGFPRDVIRTTGSIKLDVAIPLLGEAEKRELRRELGLGETDLILMGASTWPGEERALLKTWKELNAKGVACQLLLVPRHAERRSEIETELEATAPGFSHHFRSRGAAAKPVAISIGDTTGEMRAFLQLADVVFVGKSLPPYTEGQTPVESAVLGKPLLFGTGMGNFRVIAKELKASGAAKEVADQTELAKEAARLFGDASRREAMSLSAREWHQQNVGAVGRTLTVIREILSPTE